MSAHEPRRISSASPVKRRSSVVTTWPAEQAAKSWRIAASIASPSGASELSRNSPAKAPDEKYSWTNRSMVDWQGRIQDPSLPPNKSYSYHSGAPANPAGKTSVPETDYDEPRESPR